MNLRDKLAEVVEGAPAGLALYRRYGVISNPYPLASQTIDHPRLETPADATVLAALKRFRGPERSSEVIVVSGTQGIGKTNLLNSYERDLAELYRDDSAFHVVRYFPDPEAAFDGIVSRIFQALGTDYFEQLLGKVAALNASPLPTIGSYDLKGILERIRKDQEFAEELAPVMLEWSTGARLFNSHRQFLGTVRRIDTIESKIQLLRDLVNLGGTFRILAGIFLLLDELEKQDYTQSKTSILRFLLAIKALTDALPRHLFMVLAMTEAARTRYSNMLPAIGSRFQNVIKLEPIQDVEMAQHLSDKYLEAARKRASIEVPATEQQGDEPVLTPEQVETEFKSLSGELRRRAVEGITPRDFLERLRVAAAPVISADPGTSGKSMT